jgi:DNA polymerase-3 subunit gamma/tau
MAGEPSSMASGESAAPAQSGEPTSPAPTPPVSSPAVSSQAGGSGDSLALYRRYRPATFAEVKGQEQVTEPLSRALLAGRVSHAYLFSGPRGCGKTTSARILARSLNCVQGPTPEPCGICESCVALAPNGPGSIDVIEIDAASHGGVDDARELRERAFYAPVSGRFKVYIIDEAHMVTREGFNALLKLVEEPPAHLKFIFATTEPEKVIATIRSRTHHYPFRLVPPAVLRQLLAEILGREGVAWEPGALQLVIRAGAGSVRDSLSVLDQLLAGSDESGLTYDKTAFLLGYTDAALLDEVTEAFAAGDGAAVFRVVDRVVEAGLDPRRFAADMLDRFRDLIVLSAVPDAGRTGLIDAPADQLERMTEQAGRFGQAQLSRAAEVLSDGLVQMRGATAPRLLLELTCARVLLPGASTDQSALLARLERLERGAATAAPAAPSAGQATGRPDLPAAGRAEPASGAGGSPGASAEASPGPGDGAASSGAPGVPAQAQPGAHGRQADAASGAPGVPGRKRPPGRATSAQAGPVSAGPVSADPVSADPVSAGPVPAGPVPADPVPADPVPADPVPADPVSATPVPAGPVPGGPVSAGQASADQAPAGPVSAGPPDAESLRRDWESVLDAVKKVRRVAWMLLRNAVVQSLADGVLTVRFAKEGDVKGFASSGCDADLKRVLATSFGLNVQVRAVSAVSQGDRTDREGSTGAVREKPEISPRTAPARTRADQPGPAGAGRPRQADAGVAPAGRGAGDGDPFDVRDPDASAGQAALTGIDLIKRELGGQIVDETDHG